jgi:CheY-like chemotaxis protein
MLLQEADESASKSGGCICSTVGPSRPIMSSEAQPESPISPLDSMAKASSELNNALQIISGAACLIETIWKGNDRSEEYLAMLRASICRAEKAAAEFVKQAGGPEQRILLQSEIAPFLENKSAPPSSASEKSILIVDDEPMALTLVKRILTDAGYQVATAQSGFECLDLFRECARGYDLVLLDLTMPFMDGEETFHRLREIRPEASVILCAGFIQQEKLDRLMASGLAGLLRKPLAPDEIVSHVRSTLESMKYSADVSAAI